MSKCFDKNLFSTEKVSFSKVPLVPEITGKKHQNKACYDQLTKFTFLGEKNENQ